MHACVTPVTVLEHVGSRDIHEVPNDMVAGQIEAVVTDIGVQAAKTGGCWPRRASLRGRDLASAHYPVPLVDPGMHPCTGARCWHRLPWIRFAAFPLATLRLTT